MAQSVSLWGATYSNVPALDVPKDGGGTARFTDVTPTTAIASDVAQGKKFFLADGTESTGTATGDVPTIESLNVTPSTSQQTFNSSSVDGYKPVVVDAMPSGTAGTPTATKGTVSNHSVSVTPSVTNTTGYITGSTKTGTAVTVSASELVSGSETKTANGTYDVTNLASLIVNVAGGGGSGKEFETGTYTPTSDIAQPTINFTNTHSEAPVLVAMVDQSSTTHSNNSSVVCVIFYPALLFGTGYVYQNTTKRDLVAYFSYKGSSSSISAGGTHVVSSSVSTWVSKTGFSPYTNSTSRYWRRGRTYKWIAIWK